MAQNIYDDPTFFAGYSRLPRSVEGLDAAPEWPALQALLPDMRGLRVLDLGCGFGWFCRWARHHGAAKVLGIDISARMLERAGAAGQDEGISYARADLEHPALPAAAFDLAYSSLALHYVENLATLTNAVHAALAAGGRFVFSVEHPIFTAPSRPDWQKDADGRRIWPLDRYLDEGPRQTNWLADGVIKQHRTVGAYVGLLLEAGFTMTHVEEWAPSAAQIAAHPEWGESRDRPAFLLMACRR